MRIDLKIIMWLGIINLIKSLLCIGSATLSVENGVAYGNPDNFFLSVNLSETGYFENSSEDREVGGKWLEGFD